MKPLSQMPANEIRSVKLSVSTVTREAMSRPIAGHEAAVKKARGRGNEVAEQEMEARAARKVTLQLAPSRQERRKEISRRGP